MSAARSWSWAVLQCNAALNLDCRLRLLGRDHSTYSQRMKSCKEAEYVSHSTLSEIFTIHCHQPSLTQTFLFSCKQCLIHHVVAVFFIFYGLPACHDLTVPTTQKRSDTAASSHLSDFLHHHTLACTNFYRSFPSINTIVTLPQPYP